LTSSHFLANYNALQVSFTKRMRNGFQILGSYTWAKNLDEVNGEVGTDVYELQLPTNNQNNLRQSSYGPAGDDRDQRAVVSFTWTAPKLTSLSALPRRLLTDWQFQGSAWFSRESRSASSTAMRARYTVCSLAR
jgi:hypothetical protein